MTETHEHYVVLVTVPNAATATKIADALVEEQFAACVNTLPGVMSTYRWQGKVQREEELLLIIKTTHEKLIALQERVIQLHPYEVPEVIALNIADGHAAYLNWITDNTR